MTIVQAGAGFWDLSHRLALWLLPRISIITRGDFDKVVVWVKAAEAAMFTGRERANWVRKQVDVTMPYLVPVFQELLIALVVAYLGSRGDIHIKKATKIPRPDIE